jgi:hypothetical protein
MIILNSSGELDVWELVGKEWQKEKVKRNDPDEESNLDLAVEMSMSYR